MAVAPCNMRRACVQSYIGASSSFVLEPHIPHLLAPGVLQPHFRGPPQIPGLESVPLLQPQQAQARRDVQLQPHDAAVTVAVTSAKCAAQPGAEGTDSATEQMLRPRPPASHEPMFPEYPAEHGHIEVTEEGVDPDSGPTVSRSPHSGSRAPPRPRMHVPGRASALRTRCGAGVSLLGETAQRMRDSAADASGIPGPATAQQTRCDMQGHRKASSCVPCALCRPSLAIGHSRRCLQAASPAGQRGAAAAPRPPTTAALGASRLRQAAAAASPSPAVPQRHLRAWTPTTLLHQASHRARTRVPAPTPLRDRCADTFSAAWESRAGTYMASRPACLGIETVPAIQAIRRIAPAHPCMSCKRAHGVMLAKHRARAWGRRCC
jgi:hypothetical protein